MPIPLSHKFARDRCNANNCVFHFKLYMFGVGDDERPAPLAFEELLLFPTPPLILLPPLEFVVVESGLPPLPDLLLLPDKFVGPGVLELIIELPGDLFSILCCKTIFSIVPESKGSLFRD